MKIRTALLLALFLGTATLTGCISTEEPGPMKFPEEPIRRERPAPELVPPQEAITPTERWKAELAKIAPAGWTVSDAIDQLEAPDGWSRVEGGRGIAFTMCKNEKHFTIWFMPTDWKGTDDKTAPVHVCGTNKDWILFTTTKGHEGWEKAEEDVARTFGFASPARG